MNDPDPPPPNPNPNTHPGHHPATMLRKLAVAVVGLLCLSGAAAVKAGTVCMCVYGRRSKDREGRPWRSLFHTV